MGSRRKTKTERELVADINKTFLNFCIRQDCRTCKYNYTFECEIEYIKDLLKKNEED